MKIYTTIILAFLCLNVFAQAENATRLRNFNNDNGIAIKDFDPVSYFKGKAAKGTEKFAHTYKGLTYYFVNNENLEEFKKSPSKYEPAYGGWCAYHMSVDGQRVRVDPSTFKIINGKVYLFSNFNGKNYLRAWEQNEKKYKESADKLWIKKMH
ncbi:YHS domain-containing (seleno)protein [Ohtaekwangia koreensis]|jgi:YHS domain-containing protein|uniref:YHS domain-containing protein n=1 Tax=Ohtaekwangia koreensis TaxID=688867 RepID=A0A1T5KRC7_9BACT|nr:YHS domain-containing (seleno)protein [Ohtaekwangia koreensis]SKC66247.1 YHS domain-containing protein [Ohtaekwangia koreensis]